MNTIRSIKRSGVLKLPKLIVKGTHVLAIIITLFVVYQSLQPNLNPPNFSNADKVLHFLAYGTLGVLWTIALPKSGLARILLSLILLGISLEFAQHFMHWGRSASVMDVFANMLGAAFGIYITSRIISPDLN